ncbi:MAG: hypothetical protein WAW42_08700 [Candidatus Competibacteraceae bacterium]
MASRHADKQRRYRQRLREQGLVHVQGWVTPEQAEVIRRIMAERAGEAHEGTQGRKRETGACFSQNPA